jgi:hypothetical protein
MARSSRYGFLAQIPLRLALALCFIAVAPYGLAQTISINTGLTGQSGSTLLPTWQLDDDWIVSTDPVMGPHGAWVVPNLSGGHANWPAPLPRSRWISGAGNKYMGSLPPPRTNFVYQTCFQLPAAFWTPQLTMRLRSDDIILAVVLNSTYIYYDSTPNPKPGKLKAGSHLGPPLSVTWATASDFHPGSNCLLVVVQDTDSFISGLNVSGDVTLTSCVATGQVIEFDLSTGTSKGEKLGLAQADPQWTLISVPTGTPGPAYTTAAFPGAWVSNAPQPANWIQRLQNSFPQPDSFAGPYVYRLTFSPDFTTFSSFQLFVRYAADNFAQVQLNNSQLATCTGLTCYSTWQPVTAQPITLASNNLDITVTNTGFVTGLIADVKLRGICR